MSICSTMKGYTRRHEWLADLFSLMAVAVFFATVWAAIEYNGPILEWMRDNVILHAPAVVGVLVLDVALIFGLLCAGSKRCPEGSDDCFRTFRGRRHGSPSLFTAFGNWISHIEHVGKRHR